MVTRWRYTLAVKPNNFFFPSLGNLIYPSRKKKKVQVVPVLQLGAEELKGDGKKNPKALAVFNCVAENPLVFFEFTE